MAAFFEEDFDDTTYTARVENTAGNKALDRRDDVARGLSENPNLGPNPVQAEVVSETAGVPRSVKWSNDRFTVELELDDPADEGSDYMLTVKGDEEVTPAIASAIKDTLSNPPSLPTGARRHKKKTRKTRKGTRKGRKIGRKTRYSLRS